MKTRLSTFLPPLLLFFATFALFAPSIGYGLVNLDDPTFIYNNPIVFNGFSWGSLGRAFTALHGDRMMYNPILWISYLLDSLFFGAAPLNPWGYHLTNVLLHAANAVLLWFILLSAARRPWLAFFAAAVWSLHPLRVESVAWVTERKDTLSTFFAFASILFYLKAFLPSGNPGMHPPSSTRHASLVTRHCRKGLQCLALVAFVAGLLSKPMLVTLPFLFLLFDFWPLRRCSLRDIPRTLPRLTLEKWPFFLLVLLAALVTYRLQTLAIAPVPLAIRIRRLPVNYLFYLARTLWPVGLCPLASGFPATRSWVFFSCAVFFLMAVESVRSFKRAPGFLVGLLAFAGLLAPVSGIVFIGGVPVADRYSYLPSIGLSLALLSLLDLLRKRGRPACDGGSGSKSPPSTRSSARIPRLCCGISAAAILTALAAVSLHILPSWKSSEAFAARAAEIAPGHLLSHTYRFVDSFYFKGDLPTAEAAAEACWNAEHESPFATLAKILVISQTESSAAATAFFEAHPFRVLPHDPTVNALPLVLAILHADTGDFAKAIPCIDEALSNPNWMPQFAESAVAVAFWLYAIQGMDGRAAEYARRIPSMDSDHPHDPANFLLPYTAMWNQGLRRQALPHLLELAAGARDNPALLNNIAWLLATAPNSPAPSADVLDMARRAQALNPDHPVILDTLAVALASDGQFDEAIAIESRIAGFLRASSAPEAPAMLDNVEKRIALFRSRVPFTENAELKLLFAH